MNVNYLTEIRRFCAFALRVGLPASAQLLWYKLIEIMNQNAQGTQWLDGFLPIDNTFLLAYFPMSVTSLAEARRALCECGLLEYIPGEKKRRAPAYRLHYFSIPDGDAAVRVTLPQPPHGDCTTNCATDCETDCETDCTTNCETNCHADCPHCVDTADCTSDCATDCATNCKSDCATDCATDCHSKSPKSRDIYINYTETETETETKTKGTNDEANNTSDSWVLRGRAGAYTGAYASAGAGAREDAAAWQTARSTVRFVLREECTDAQLSPLMAVYGRYHPERGVLIQAIVHSAEAANPLSEAAALLETWGKAGVRSVAELVA